MKLKYLDELINRFVGLKNGVTRNFDKWNGQPETSVTLQSNINELEEQQNRINEISNQLKTEKAKARQLQKRLKIVADTIKNKAIGFHTANPGKLVEYNINLRKTYEKKPVPSIKLSVKIKDDTDKIGFILSTKADPTAETYEWERGIADDATNLNTIPSMQFYKSTSKASFTDNNIEPGKRYFYRVRAINSSGDGAWSPASSRVQ